MHPEKIFWKSIFVRAPYDNIELLIEQETTLERITNPKLIQMEGDDINEQRRYF